MALVNEPTEDGSHYVSPSDVFEVQTEIAQREAGASASARTRVANARSRRSRWRGGCASLGVEVTNDPTPRLRFDDAGAFQLGVDARHGIGVDAQVHRELPDGRQLVARPQPARGDRRPQPALELRVNRRCVARIDLHDVHLTVLY